MQIKVLSNDGGFVEALAADKPLNLEVGTPTHVPGAIGSWWELLAALGIVGLPVGVAGNLIASWIWKAIDRTRPEPSPVPCNPVRIVKLVLREDENTVDVQIEAADPAMLELSVMAAIRHVLNKP